MRRHCIDSEVANCYMQNLGDTVSVMQTPFRGRSSTGSMNSAISELTTASIDDPSYLAMAQAERPEALLHSK